jgi:chromosome segregation ATPase
MSDFLSGVNPQKTVEWCITCVTFLAGFFGVSQMIVRAKYPKASAEGDSVASPKSAETDDKYLSAKFEHGSQRMEAIEKRVETCERNQVTFKDELVEVKIELAELRPTFQGLRDVVGNLKDGLTSVEGVLNEVLRRLPYK